MIVKLLVYITFWVGLFCMIAAGLLWASVHVQHPWLKALASRLGATDRSGGTPVAIEVFGRLAACCVAGGLLVLLFAVPGVVGPETSRWTVTLVEAGCAVVLLWQIQALRALGQRPHGPKPVS